MNTKFTLSVVAAGALALGASACGSDSKNSTDNSGSGSTSVKPLAQIDKLTGKSTAVKLDSGFVSALTQLKVTPAPLGSAKITKGGSAVFPITGGNVKYFKPGSVSPYVQGTVDHQGSGLSLTAGKTVVDLQNFVVDPGTSQLTGKVSVDGKVAAASAPLFFLDGRTLKPLKVKKGKGIAILKGTTVKLTSEAADLLNKTFKITALKKNLVIGVAKITVNVS